MAVHMVDIIRSVIIIILLILHCSVTWFIFWMVKIQKNKSYNSAYFLLYLILSVADIALLITNFLCPKAFLIESWKAWFLAHPEYSAIVWLLSGYWIFFQCLLHGAIAINRLWTAFNLKADNSVEAKIGNIIICFLPLIAFAIVAPRIFGRFKYVITIDNELALSYEDDFTKNYQSIAGPILVISTSFICFILAIITILRYRQLFKQFQNNQLRSSIKHDILLFFQAFVVLFFQLLLTGYYLMGIIGRTQNLPGLQAFSIVYFGYITDASSLCNPIALLTVCKFIRQDYFKYILRRKTDVIVISTITQQNNNQTARHSIRSQR